MKKKIEIISCGQAIITSTIPTGLEHMMECLPPHLYYSKGKRCHPQTLNLST